MAEPRCEMCFKAKQTSPAQPGMTVLVCRGCFYEIDRVIGFLELAATFQDGRQSVMQDLGSSDPEDPELASTLEAERNNPPNPPGATATSVNGTGSGRGRKKT